MKKIFIICLFVISCVTIHSNATNSSATSSKKATKTDKEETSYNNPCEAFISESPLLRACGEATGPRMMMGSLETEARSSAQRAYTKKLLVGIDEALTEIGVSLENKTLKKESNSIGIIIESYNYNPGECEWKDEIISRIMKDLKICNTFFFENGFDVGALVLLEYKGDADQMTEQIINVLEEKLPDEDRSKINNNQEKFKEKFIEVASKIIE